MASTITIDSSLQPEWGGLDDCAVIQNPKAFIQELINEDAVVSLSTRSYAVIELSPAVMEDYAQFSNAFDAFCEQPLSEKSKFATKMKDSQTAVYSPNQYHGYSRMEGLKEQYMIRACGPKSQLTMPGAYPLFGRTSAHMGKTAMILNEQLDQICRVTLRQVAKHWGIPVTFPETLIDPLPNLETTNGQKKSTALLGGAVSGTEGGVCTTSYYYPNYISSSLLDVFHYGNTFEESDGSHVKFKNNHLSHSDSGILTLVPCADVAGLEVLDQKLNQWINLEELIHNVTRTEENPFGHRRYATIFWGDSLEYLQKKNRIVEPCMHRVARSDVARHSIVYKMRTLPTVTAPRYQEDYELADIQYRSIATQTQRKLLLSVGIGGLVAATAALVLQRVLSRN